MSDVVIRVENLSKRYRIRQGTRAHYETLYDQLAHALTPWRWFRSGNLRAQDDYIWALKDVSFEVKRGEVVGIIGRNGAGKSTLLKVLARITEPTEGYAEVRGRVGSLLEVGTGFHPELTGRENIYLNGAILGMRKAEIDRKFDEIVAFAEIEKFVDTPVKFYSSGMYVRLAFAVAAHLDPEILLVDEVLAVGDAAFQKKCLGKMGEVAGEGRTVLFVSHNVGTIDALCSRSIVLSQGNIAYCGSVSMGIDVYLTMMRHYPDGKGCRTGNWLRKIETKDSKGCIKKQFRINEPIHVLIDVDTQGQVLWNPEIGIGIDNSRGMRVFTVGTYFSPSKVGQLCGKVRIDCEIVPPPLAPGTYYAKVALSKGYLETVEEIENAFELEIQPQDYYGTGRFPSARQGNVLVRSYWKVINGD